jgi:hypothetical protein
MSTVAESIAIARRCLDDEDLRFALIGGFAVSARSEPRFTRDVDLAVSVADDAQAEATVRRLVTDGHELVATVEQEAVGRLATARFRLVGGDLLDLLFASSGIETEIVAAAGPDDRAVASSAVDLVSARGYGRGRDLAADLVELFRPAG